MFEDDLVSEADWVLVFAAWMERYLLTLSSNCSLSDRALALRISMLAGVVAMLFSMMKRNYSLMSKELAGRIWKMAFL